MRISDWSSDVCSSDLVSKYADHLPLYRQAQIYARQGVSLDRSTLADWVGRAAFLLRPVHARLLETLKASGKLFADETPPRFGRASGRERVCQFVSIPVVPVSLKQKQLHTSYSTQ